MRTIKIKNYIIVKEKIVYIAPLYKISDNTIKDKLKDFIYKNMNTILDKSIKFGEFNEYVLGSDYSISYEICLEGHHSISIRHALISGSNLSKLLVENSNKKETDLIKAVMDEIAINCKKIETEYEDLIFEINTNY